MVYAPSDDGVLRLAAVEWVVPKALWKAEHGVGAAPPTVLGHEMHILNPALGWYVAHAVSPSPVTEVDGYRLCVVDRVGKKPA